MSPERFKEDLNKMISFTSYYVSSPKYTITIIKIGIIEIICLHSKKQTAETKLNKLIQERTVKKGEKLKRKKET